MGLNAYQIKAINERYSVLWEQKACDKCGSLQAAMCYDMKDGRPRVELICLKCGTTTTPPRYTCDRQANTEKLSDWRQIVLNNDDRRCHICGSFIQVEAHHIIPKSHDIQGRYWYAPTNGIALCRRCHELVHGEWMTNYYKHTVTNWEQERTEGGRQMLKITTGKIPRAQKVVLYGVEGIGKTTLAAQTPEPLFIDTEGGTSHLDVRRLQRPKDWETLLALVREVGETPGVCKTLIVDTADWAEQAMTQYILRTRNLKSIEDAGYGKGYTYLGEEFAGFLRTCDRLITQGINIVITAHAKMRKFEQPDEMGAYDRWEMKLSKQVAPLLKEWADAVLFLAYKTIVITTETKTKKAQGGKRVIYTTHKPTYDAKNRHGLPDELPLEYASIAPIFDSVQASPERPSEAAQSAPTAMDDKFSPATPETLQTLSEWMSKAHVTAEELQTVVAMKGYFPPETPYTDYPDRFIRNWIMKNWDRIVTTINEDPNHLPF